MKFSRPVLSKLLMTAAVGLGMIAAQNASAAIVITEVDPSGSGTSSYAADWYELTNTGSSAVNITGWKMDDNSDSFSLAVPLRGVTSIAAGQSVVFLEGTASGSTDATIDSNFTTAWFGATPPAGLTIGNYGGSGVGLSTGGDAVNIFDASGNAVAGVNFGASSTTGATFDNSAGLSAGATISTFSQVGVNGAFTSADGKEIGSPGFAPVPLPSAAWLMLSGLAGFGVLGRRKRSA